MGSLAKDSRSLLVDMINSSNGTSLDYDELVISAPTANDPLVNNRNTTVSVTAADGVNLSGSENFYYNRVDFSAVFMGMTVTLGGAGISDISGFLLELNTTYGLGLTMDDLVAQSLSSSPTYPLTITIVASPTSYAYTGQFQAIVQNTQPQLSNNLTTSVLCNIGTDSATLWSTIWDVRKLAATIIQLNLYRFKQASTIRGLHELVEELTNDDSSHTTSINSLGALVGTVQDQINAMPTGDKFEAIRLSDLISPLGTTTQAGFWVVPCDCTLVEAFTTLLVAQSTTGAVVVDGKVSGTSIFSTDLSVDALSNSSLDSDAPAELATTAFTKGQVVVWSITSAGTGAKGLQVNVRYTPT